MKKLSIIFLILGAIISFLGMLPFIFAYPVCHDCPNSGPSNTWELILMLSYDGKGWALLIGVVLLLFSVYLLAKQRKEK